jgi:hypothetical protein
MQTGTKDTWDKADIILKPLGGLLTALAVAYFGFLGSQYLKHKESIETNAQLYAELLSKKQERDIAFRRDLLKPVIEAVQAPGPANIDTKMLNLEFLAANYQESLDLGPFLKHVHAQLLSSPSPRKEEYIRRLERDADEIKSRQVITLAGQLASSALDFDDFKAHPEGVQILERDLRLHSDETDDREKRHFLIQAFRYNPQNREIQVRLIVTTQKKIDKHVSNVDANEPELDAVLWVGLFDFPMVHNFPLSHGQRCAIILNRFSEFGAQVALVYFPESSEDPVQVLKKRLAETN